MHLRLPTICSGSTKNSIETAGSAFGALDRHSLAHDGATTGKDLKIGHGPSAWRSLTSGGGERAKSGGGGFVEEGTHGTRLTK